MATYKVLQDIEAEDKLVGPFSLRQFIYAAIAAVSGFIAFKLASVNTFLITPFVPVVVLFVVLAAPFGHDQPSEVWLLARIRFFLKPHKRIWNQSGMINLVTITVPKKIQRRLTKNLTQSEVNSRLSALANTIDSRGWAVKNVNVNLSNQSSTGQISSDSDRLIDPSTLPQDVPSYDVTAADDMLDTRNNPTAQHVEQLIVSSNQEHHQKIIDSMNNGPAQSSQSSNPDYWFMNNAAGQAQPPPGYAQFTNDPLVTPGDDPTNYSSSTSPLDDAALAQEIEEHKKTSRIGDANMHRLEPLSEHATYNNAGAVSNSTNQTGATNPPTTTDPAIINLALANKDNWSVATIAHQAEEAQKKLPPQDEVIISLH